MHMITFDLHEYGGWMLEAKNPIASQGGHVLEQVHHLVMFGSSHSIISRILEQLSKTKGVDFSSPIFVYIFSFYFRGKFDNRNVALKRVLTNFLMNFFLTNFFLTIFFLLFQRKI